MIEQEAPASWEGQVEDRRRQKGLARGRMIGPEDAFALEACAPRLISRWRRTRKHLKWADGSSCTDKPIWSDL